MVRLTQQQINFYKDNGYINISGIFTEEELKEFLQEYERVFYVKNNPGLEAAWGGDAMKVATGNQAHSGAVLGGYLLTVKEYVVREPALVIIITAPYTLHYRGMGLPYLKGVRAIVHHAGPVRLGGLHTRFRIASNTCAGFLTMFSFTVHSIHNLQFHSAVFLKLLTNDSLLEALEDVMGTPNILLHHTKAHWKPAKNGAPFLIHQDYHYFPYKNDSMVAAFIHLDKSNPENGGLCVYPGSHKLGPQEDMGAVETANRYHYCDPRKFPLEKATSVDAEFGDVVIFSYLLLHGSYKNLSERPRRMFLIQLMSAEDVALEEKHKSPGQGLVLRGRNDNRKAVLAERFLH